MNTILQNRIEEAAEEYANSTTSNLLNVFETTGRFKGFNQGAIFALQNQWISVEEALPKTSNGFSKEVLCIDNRGCKIVAKYQDKVGWWSRGGTHWNTNGFTHWMSIPTLEGGEK